uniref:Uncharacterized protein n=1 Tax=Pithovirus LCPAC202 TaxID=2506592 RepID=A0A481Z5J1_9VIRU|nr:MAG: hypothetical protein LCPAC202_01020 [Pithovirus LCPAC202]
MQTSPRIEVLPIDSTEGKTEYLKTTKDLRAHLKLVKRYHKDISDWKALSGWHHFGKFTVPIPADMNPANIKSKNQKIVDEKTAEIIQINAGLARLRLAYAAKGGQVEITAGMITQLSTEYGKLVNEIVKIVSGMRKRKPKLSKQRAGFSIPQRYNAEIVNFFKNAGAANIMPVCNGQTMEQLAPNFFSSGVASQNMMRNMLMVYAYNAAQPQLVRYATTNGGTIGANNVPVASTSIQRPNNQLKRGFLGVDLFMQQNLQVALQTARNKEGTAKSGARPIGLNARREKIYRFKDVHKRFDVNNFKLGSLQSIGAAVKLTPAELANSPLPIMSDAEKDIYRRHVLGPERAIKLGNKASKKLAKANKTDYVATLIPYMVATPQYPQTYISTIEAELGGQIPQGSAMLLQLAVDAEDQSLTVFRNCLKNASQLKPL